MAAKYQLITELYRRTGVAVAKNPQAWQGFLSSACRNYKCRFDEQLLIYAQRPDAVAVAKLETWNRQFKRWVNKDSKGIAVFDPKGRRNTLKYYFDVSDTHEGYYGSRPVPIWQMDERYEQAVMERLSDRFGDVESTDLASDLMETAKNAVEDNLQDYFSQLKDCTKDSFLEELDDFNIEVIYRRLAANSVAFMLISRCGLDTNEFFDRDDFADIVNFNTPATINAIGIATSDIAEMALREISQSIRNVQMAEKDQNRTFAQRTQAQYDKGRQQPERSEYNERNHLQQTGGLSYSRPNITDRARASAWQVRFDAQGLSGEAQASDLDKAAIASERMKSAYVGIKEKAEQGYYADENSATEYAADRISYAADRVKDEGIHQFNKQGQKAVKTTQKNIGKAKDKISDFKKSRAVKAAEQKAIQNMSEQHGLQIRHGAASRSSAPDVSQTAKSQLIKTRQQGQKMIKTTARNTEKAVKATAKGTVKTTEKGIKTAQATSKAAIKTTETSVKTAQAAAKASAKTVQKAAQAAKATAKATAEATKATVRATIAAVKAIIAGTKALISALIAGGWITVVIILIVVLLGCAVSLFGGGSGSNAYTPVSAEVEAYEPLIQKYAKQYGIPEYVELIKAVMMQESGGRGLDPMQAAEGSFNTRYPHEPNGIQDPEYSIECGVQELKAALISAEVENPIDMEHIKLALQGYNFGNGYISWAKTNYGGYSYANAVEFSTMQAARLGWDSYGDTQYPAHVLRYYPYGRAFTSGGNQAIVEVALTQLGNEGGQPYWSWYGFDGRVEWCACFVSWCADQCGYIESGIIPKFSGCVDGSNWFKGNGQWQDRNYDPQAGDIIFFDWEGDGETDHVGIVEKCENGVVYTVEGNSGDACRQKQYTVGSSSIYGYGVPAY